MTMVYASREQLRAQARALLDESSPADALAVYYAVYCPTERAELFVHANDQTPRPDGFLVRARTGMDLFRPLVTLRAANEMTALALLQTGIMPNRPIYLTVPESHALWVNKHLSVTDAELCRVYRLRADRHVPIMNVLTVTTRAPNGLPHCEIRSGDKASAMAGVNWQTPRYAEVYVYTDPAVRGRGWGKAVVSTLTDLLLKDGRTPLYVVSENNDYSIRLAEAIGFDDTGTREYIGQAVRTENP